jgi:ribosome-binding factor A
MTARPSERKGPTQRQLRAGELVRHALVEILQREDLREPALKGVSITISEVRMTPDLQHATAFATPLGGANAAEAIAALNRSAAYLRGLLGRRIEMRYTPSLKFLADESFDQAQRVEELLARPDVARDLDGGKR